MKLSKTSVQSVDLDDLERQLREVAVSSLPKKNEDPLGELARIVGREKPLRSIVGGRAEAGQSVPQPAVANDTAPAQMRARPAESESEAETADWEGEVEDAAEEQFAYEGDEDVAPSYEEDWQEEPEDNAADAENVTASRFDAVEQVPDMRPEAAEKSAAPRRGLLSPRALAVSVPVLLALIGVGAAVVTRGAPGLLKPRGDAPVIKADDSPVKVQPANAASSDQTPSQAALDAADPLSKPSQVVLARPEQPVDVVAAVKDAQSRGPAPAKPPASAGIVVIAGPGASPASPGAAAPAAGGAAPASPPSAGPMPSAASLPLPEPPQPSGDGSVFGPPRRVATVAVKPDGTIVPSGKPKIDAVPPKRIVSADPVVPADPPPAASPLPGAAAPSADASGSAPAAPAPSGATPAPKNPTDTVRAKPSPAVVASGEADAKPPRAAAKPKLKVADVTPTSHATDARADGAPLSITPQGRHGRQQVAEASPPAAAAAISPNAARGDSGFSVQLASSQSESDARATLSRLQRQFPSTLGGGSIRRADLGAKGVYYRVRVGPLTRDAADKICAQLKSGGAECILTRG